MHSQASTRPRNVHNLEVALHGIEDNEAMEKRKQRRQRRGVQCEIRTAAAKATGLVENVSAHGLFVKTAAHLRPGSVIDVIIPSCGIEGGLQVEAGVARCHAGSRRFEAMSVSGVGLQVIPPWNAFERWVLQQSLPPLKALDPLDAAMILNQPVPIRVWKAQLVHRDRTRGRALTFECESLDQARMIAEQNAGRDWLVRSLIEA